MPITAATTSARTATRTGRMALTILLGFALTTLAAKIQVPFWPVPMTLHTMAVLGIAVFFGPRIAIATFAAYLAAGAAGLPVFAGSPERGIGLAYLMGPTGGYLIGYLVASWLVGTLAQSKGTIGRFLAMLAGMVPVYVLGMAGLARFVPVDQLLQVGVTPFIVGDLVKIALVAAMGLAVRSMRARQDNQQ